MRGRGKGLSYPYRSKQEEEEKKLSDKFVGLDINYINIILLAAIHRTVNDCSVEQCLSAAGPRPGTGPWHQL